MCTGDSLGDGVAEVVLALEDELEYELWPRLGREVVDP